MVVSGAGRVHEVLHKTDAKPRRILGRDRSIRVSGTQPDALLVCIPVALNLLRRWARR